jgi:hypothetical protein
MSLFHVALKTMDPNQLDKSRQEFADKWAVLEPVVLGVQGITVQRVGRFSATLEASTPKARSTLESVLPAEWHAVDIQKPAFFGGPSP